MQDYDELRTGFELYLRRRVFELVEARASYRLEEVESGMWREITVSHARMMVRQRMMELRYFSGSRGA